MLVNAANITEKKYQKLTIQVSLNGMSFCTSDTLNHKILAVAQIEFDTKDLATVVKCLEERNKR
jgi:hypothetical protein